jgi:phosphonopyruvate decarboxylase
MERIVSLMGRFDATVATTGFAARELYELRKKLEQDSSKDFLCVGSMGHASSIAMGVSLGKPSKQVYCMDGDGAMLMHMGSIPQIGTRDLPNFKHILFNNESHDSVGGQPTVAGNIDIPAIAQACGYRYTGVATTFEEIESEM